MVQVSLENIIQKYLKILEYLGSAMNLRLALWAFQLLKIM